MQNAAAAARRVHVSGPSQQDARGLALLLGWAGGALKHVQKHAAMWHRAGWRTAAAEMTIDMTFFPAAWSSLPQVVDVLLREAREHRRTKAGSSHLAVHNFSNAGTFLMNALLKAECGQLVLDGVVYDSCPSPLEHVGPWAAPMVISSSGLSTSATAYQLARHVPYALAASLATPLLGASGPMRHHAELWDAPPRPELFVYSPADRLVSAAGIEAFMAHRRRQGCEQQVGCRLADSPHCTHLVTHPERYGAEIGAFAERLAAADEATLPPTVPPRARL